MSEHTHAPWEECIPIGCGQMGPGEPVLEYRNCPTCKSTLTREVFPFPAIFASRESSALEIVKAIRDAAPDLSVVVMDAREEKDPNRCEFCGQPKNSAACQRLHP